MTVAEVPGQLRPTHHWTSSAEPHALRRKLMLQKYGDQIRPLMGYDPFTCIPVAAACVAQTVAALAVGRYDVPWWGVVLLSYLVSAFLAGNLMAAHHEITHFLVLRRPSWNRWLAVFANAPCGFPLGSLFKQYHVDHHSDMGVEGVDTGIWTALEARWVGAADGNWLAKLILLIVFPIFFFLRPFFMMVFKKPDWTDLACWIVVPAYDVAICYFGGGSLKPLAYVLLGMYWGVGPHPIAGHVISEHCMMTNDGQETHSCYDPLLNPLLYNFGYHVEHHDFPGIPWTRLAQLRGIAPEFYQHLTSYPSWTGVLWKFVTDPSVGINGVMTHRAVRTGGTKNGDGAAIPAHRFKQALAMPLLRGITPLSIN